MGLFRGVRALLVEMARGEVEDSERVDEGDDEEEERPDEGEGSFLRSKSKPEVRPPPPLRIDILKCIEL